MWSQNENNAFEVTLSSSTSASPTFTAPTVTSDQTLTFSLTVNDGAVDSTPDTVIVTILDTDGNGVPNLTPTAHAGDDQTVGDPHILLNGAVDKEVTLNGSATDPDTDDTITYLWSQTQGPTVTLSSSTSASPTFTAPTVTSDQTLTFSLTVNDGAVDSTPDTVDITIQNTINESPTADAGDDQTVNEGASVTLDGTGSADPNGDTITERYLWSQNENNAFEVTLSSSTSASPTFTAPTVTSDQTLTFSLTVNDGAVDSTPDTVIVTILDTDGNGVPNLTPTAHAGDDQTVNEGDDVTLDGTGSADPNGDTITYLWTVNDGAVDSTPDTVIVTILDRTKTTHLKLHSPAVRQHLRRLPPQQSLLIKPSHSP